MERGCWNTQGVRLHSCARVQRSPTPEMVAGREQGTGRAMWTAYQAWQLQNTEAHTRSWGKTSFLDPVGLQGDRGC